MDAAVLLEVIPSAEPLGAHGAGEGPQAGVNPLVPGQLLVPRERFPAGFFVAFEWSFTY